MSKLIIRKGEKISHEWFVSDFLVRLIPKGFIEFEEPADRGTFYVPNADYECIIRKVKKPKK